MAFRGLKTETNCCRTSAVGLGEGEKLGLVAAVGRIWGEAGMPSGGPCREGVVRLFPWAGRMPEVGTAGFVWFDAAAEMESVNSTLSASPCRPCKHGLSRRGFVRGRKEASLQSRGGGRWVMGDGLKDELRFRLRRRKLGVTQSLTSLSATGTGGSKRACEKVGGRQWRQAVGSWPWG